MEGGGPPSGAGTGAGGGDAAAGGVAVRAEGQAGRVARCFFRRVDARGHPLRQPRARAVRAPPGLKHMAARIDPFIEVLLRERGDQLYLLPDEPVTMVKDGKSRRVSKQPLTDQHIYALLVEVAPSESADHIDQMAETEFEYIADRGMVRVRIVPEAGRLTAMVAPIGNSQATPAGGAAGSTSAAQRAPAPTPAAPQPRPPKS